MKTKHLLKGYAFTPLSIFTGFWYSLPVGFLFSQLLLPWQHPTTHCHVVHTCSEPDMAPNEWQMRPHCPFMCKTERNPEMTGVIKPKYKLIRDAYSERP